MKIELPSILASNHTQPAAATILANNPSRVDAVITYLTGGPFYIKRGTSPSSSSFTWKLSTAGQTITIENYRGILTASPTPLAGDINVAEGIDRVP